MNIEKERKFFVKEFPKDLITETPLFIRQSYLLFDDKKNLRIRTSNGIHTLCYKHKIGKGINREYEYEVTKEEADELHNSTTIWLDKIRYKVQWGKFIIEIDQYSDIKMSEDITHKGLVVAEIEYVDDFPNELPEWLGEEITGDKRYTNIERAILEESQKKYILEPKSLL